jgi:hypothetical protein
MPLMRGSAATRRGSLLAIGILLCAAACTRFHGLRPVEPSVGRPAHYPKVDSLQPTLAWKASPEPGARYDLAICPSESATLLAGRTGSPGDAVYYREGIEQTAHKVETPLAPRTKYLWSVRVRTESGVSDWSTYDYMYGGRVGEQYLEKRLPYRFRTPGR